MFFSVLLLMVLVATLVHSSNATTTTTTTTRDLVGGYGPILDMEDPMIVNAAKFALLKLFVDKPYDFLNPLEGDQEAFVPLVVSGSKQVVAGLNLKLVLMIQKVDESGTKAPVCQGAMEVEVYLKLDKTMEVTEWGDEFTCDQAQLLLEERLRNEEKDGGN